jgi:hypothetical protein
MSRTDGHQSHHTADLDPRDGEANSQTTAATLLRRDSHRVQVASEAVGARGGGARTSRLESLSVAPA